MKLEFSRQVS